MKKFSPVLLLIIVVAILGGAYFIFMNKGKGEIVLPGEIKKEEGQSDEVFTGKLNEAMAKGIAMKCTFKNAGITGTGYIKGENYYAEIISEGKSGYIIMKDNCMWTWDKTNSQGVKTCFEETQPTDTPQEQEVAASTEGEYTCQPAVFSDAQFTPPSNVQFLDMQDQYKMMQQNR